MVFYKNKLLKIEVIMNVVTITDKKDCVLWKKY